MQKERNYQENKNTHTSNISDKFLKYTFSLYIKKTEEKKKKLLSPISITKHIIIRIKMIRSTQ